jgi:hypothetical protein
MLIEMMTSRGPFARRADEQRALDRRREGDQIAGNRSSIV